jgi:predicted enzyme related to lactoylglutathione lyase
VTDIDIMFCAVPVTDFDSAVDWYSRLFGRDCDVVVHDSEVMWRIADAAWLYVLADAPRAGQTVVTLCVGNLDQALAELASRDIESGEIELVGDHGRKAIIQDADGNSISFIEVKSA